MRVAIAQEKDVVAWLRLASEVEHLFGPMVGDPRFRGALSRNIARGTAYCVREGNGPPGVPLRGALLFSPKPPTYTIGWLAVARRHRRHGVGKLLVEHVVGLAAPPGEMVVTTFGPDIAAGEPARRFYERMGFRPAEIAECGPGGDSRQIYRRTLR
jgi:GNAT superfamily N-acetyltransferase